MVFGFRVFLLLILSRFPIGKVQSFSGKNDRRLLEEHRSARRDVAVACATARASNEATQPDYGFAAIAGAPSIACAHSFLHLRR